MIVADANVVASLVLPGEQSETAEALQRVHAEWVAPPLLLCELRSVFSKLVRSHRQTALQGLDLLTLALQGVDELTFEPDSQRVLELVAASGCSSYDCEYVAVAEELGCTLATFDAEVLRAFPGIAVHPQALVSRA